MAATTAPGSPMRLTIPALLLLLLLLTLASSAQAQQVYRCLSQGQTELEYSDKPCPEGSANAARIDVTPNSAATAAALAAGHGAATAVAPPPPSGPVNNPLRDADEPAAEPSDAWAKSNPKPEASTTFDQESLRMKPAARAMH